MQHPVARKRPRQLIDSSRGYDGHEGDVSRRRRLWRFSAFAIKMTQMLPDWPKQKLELQRQFDRAVRRVIRDKGPVAAQAPRVILGEGMSMTHVYPDGTEVVSPLEPHEARWEAAADSAVTAPQLLQNAVEGLGTEMASQMERDLFSRISAPGSQAGSKFSGNTVEEISANILSAFRNMDFSFDYEGKPGIFLAVSPNNTQFYEAIQDPRLAEQVQEIIEEKRREWLARESNRRLVD